MARRYTFLRHSHAEPQVGEGYGAERAPRLSERGIGLAHVRRNKLRRNFDLAMHSPFPRAKETTIVLAPYTHMVSLNDLCWEDKTPFYTELFRMYGALGSKSYGEYRNLDTGKVFETRGREGWGRISAFAENTGSVEILIVGHNPFLPAFGLAAIAGCKRSDWEDALCNTLFGNCEGYEIIEDGVSITGVELIRG